MAPRTKAGTAKARSQTSCTQRLTWSAGTELIGLTFELEALSAGPLPANYTVGLHAWFLDQVRQVDPALSAYLRDGESEKPFTLSNLDGPLISSGKDLQLHVGQTYRWFITVLSQPVVQWLQHWLQHLPAQVELRQAPLQIRQVTISHPATTYAQLVSADYSHSTVTLSFLTPTSFRRKGNHYLPKSSSIHYPARGLKPLQHPILHIVQSSSIHYPARGLKRSGSSCGL